LYENVAITNSNSLQIHDDKLLIESEQDQIVKGLTAFDTLAAKHKVYRSSFYGNSIKELPI